MGAKYTKYGMSNIRGEGGSAWGAYACGALRQSR